jgi:hypothetical protein
VRGGIARGERVLCFTDEVSPAELLQCLSERALDVDEYVKSTQLSVATARESYLARGVFHPNCVVDQWKTTVKRALERGYSGLRVSGELSWALRNIPGREYLVEYERQIDHDIFAKYPVTGMCEFDMRRFDASWVERIFDLHGMIATSA